MDLNTKEKILLMNESGIHQKVIEKELNLTSTQFKFVLDRFTLQGIKEIREARKNNSKLSQKINDIFKVKISDFE